MASWVPFSGAFARDDHCDAAGWPRHTAAQTGRDGALETWKTDKNGIPAPGAVTRSGLSVQFPSLCRV